LLPQTWRSSRKRRSTTNGARFVARADLWVVGTRRIHEYDGEVHRDREVHRTDLARERRLVEIDWQRVGFTSPQLVCEGGSIIAGMDRLLRTWNPRRLARWEALLAPPIEWTRQSNAPMAAL
jgi:very-short-patch-repair endonuclease